MALDERARHELFSRVASALGAEAAETLMGYLPPVGWADVVTKHDVDQLREHTELRLELTEQRVLANLRSEMAAQTRTLLFAMIGVMLALTSAILAAVKI
jgi:hypothetical protein